MADDAYIIHGYYDRRQIVLIGRLSCGSTFKICDKDFEPHFFMRRSDYERLEKEGLPENLSFHKSDCRTMDDEDVCRVTADDSGSFTTMIESFHDQGIRTYEGDVNALRHYLLEKGICSTLRISGDWQQGAYVDRLYESPTIAPASAKVDLSCLSFDIETAVVDGEAATVLAIAMVMGDRQKTLLLYDHEIDQDNSELQVCGNEYELLKAFQDSILEWERSPVRASARLS